MERIDESAAQIMAIKNAVAALMYLHPDQAALRKLFHQCQEATMGGLLQQAVPEEFLDAVLRSHQTLLHVVGGSELP